MGLQRLILWLGPLLYVAGAAWFAVHSTPRQRRAVLWTWVLPGLGHWRAGFRSRGVFFGVQLLGLFIVGLWLSDFRCISPFDRHPIWALLQIPSLVPTALTTILTSSLRITADNPLYQAGCLYAGVACLLNLVAMCDVYDLLREDQPAPVRSDPA